MDLGPCPECGRRNPPDARFCGGCGYMTGSGVGEARENVADPLVGRVVADRYRIMELIGRGGMGVVYKVEHVHINKFMAMKLLHGELARDRNTIKRFQREADAASRLNHPNTVQVFDFGRSEGMMYLVMEYLEGEDFGDVIRGAGKLEFERVARIAAQVCSSVAEAHGHGIVHRDIKPENIMIVPRVDGEGEIAKVLDFGLAKLRDHGGNNSVTRAGAIVGTPYYMPPEQIRGEEVDARGDIYALGAVIYKACTGVPPFVSSTPMGVLTKHLTEELVLPSTRSGLRLPIAVDRIVGRAMEKDPADRFQSCDEMRGALLDFLSGAGISLTDPGGPRQSQRPTAAPPERATRAEVELYERRIRRRGAFGTFMVVAMLAGLCAAAVAVYQHYVHEGAPALTVEMEPNNTPAEAHELPMEQPVTGYLGRRESVSIGDVDLYRIHRVGGGEGNLEVEVTGIPNIDLVIDVYRDGQTQTLLSANSAPVGGTERIFGFPITGQAYILRIRELWVSGTPPTENISDAYSVQWRLTQPEPGWEQEINDSLGRSNALAIDAPIQARIGWGGDLDVYCVSETEGDVRLSVTAIPEIDLVLRPMDREALRSHIVDEGAIGEPEATTLPARGLCVEVSAKRDGPKVMSNPNQTYTIQVVRP
ncbi:MAG: tRNA A-37 threonylcarbamoyl transferase component Bud32 [Polyangiales bacterium]|jgi:tRNA A-37 threonylcarbamoyl transferase component Bud32